MTGPTDLEGARILIVDDEPANVRLLERLLGQAGYTDLRSTTDPRAVVSLVLAAPPDLIVLDLMMPGLDGVEVMHQLTREVPTGSFRPVLVLTADATIESKRRALAAGASDFLTKPFDHVELLLRVGNLLRTRFLHLELARQNDRLEEQVRERTAQLLEAERLVTMGQLLAGVAHELNNPLSVIVGHADLLLMDARDAAVAGHATKITSAAARCVRIVRSFLAMARRRPPERAMVALGDVVREAADLLAYELRTATIDVGLDLPAGVPSLWADRHQLQQVLINLVTNAMHAMREVPVPRHLELAMRHDAGRGLVVLTVADTGPGIAPDLRERIFEPFFTTKPEGVGTGLGLAISRSIAESHGGCLAAEPAPGGGTVFRMELPAATAAGQAREAPVARTRPAPPARVLIVDDEADVAALLLQVLSRDGHVAEIASNGAEALEKLRRASYDLILTDSGMPFLSGLELYRHVQRDHPVLSRRIVFITGDVLNAETEAFIDGVGAPHVRKPFTVEAVREVVSRTLQGSTP